MPRHTQPDKPGSPNHPPRHQPARRVCHGIRNPTEPQTIRVGPTPSASIRVSRHTQHNKSTNPNRLGPQQAHLAHAQTYATRQTRLPRPSTTPSIRTPRMSRHTQSDKPARDTSRHRIARRVAHVRAYTTRLVDGRKGPVTHHLRQPACLGTHNATDRTVRGPTHAMTDQVGRITIPSIAKGHRARIHSHNHLPDHEITDSNRRRSQECEDSLTHCRIRRPGPGYRGSSRATVRGFTHTTTVGRNRMKVPGNDKGHPVRIHSHTAGPGGRDRDTEGRQGALCED